MSKLKLRIPGYDRVINDPHYKGWVPMLSYSLGGGAMGSGSVDSKDVSLIKEWDLLTPLIFKAVGSGQHFSEVVIIHQGLPPGSPLAVLQFSDVLFSSYQNSGSHGDAPTDSISFNYGKMASMSQAQYLGLKGGAAALYNLASWFH